MLSQIILSISQIILSICWYCYNINDYQYHYNNSCYDVIIFNFCVHFGTHEMYTCCNFLKMSTSLIPSIFQKYVYWGSVITCCSVAQLCPTLCDPMDYSMSGFPVLHHLLELAQTHVHWVGDAIQPSHFLLYPTPAAFNLSQHQGLSSESVLCIVSKRLELQLQHQSFQWIFRNGLL